MSTVNGRPTITVGTVGHIDHPKTDTSVLAFERIDNEASPAFEEPPEPAHMKFVRDEAKQQRRRTSR